MIQIPAMALLDRVRRFVPAEVWLIVAAFALLIGFLVWAYFRGVDDQKDRQAVEVAKTERVASSARETASTERLTDDTSSQARLDERNADAYATPDSTPSARDFRRGCRLLRDAGVHAPECSGLDGTP